MTTSPSEASVRSPEERRDTIRTELELLAPLIAEAFQAKDWEHFGYDTWAGYFEAEFGSFRLPRLVRRDAAVMLRTSRMPTQAIAKALGVSLATIERDLAVGTNVPTDPPEPIPSIDETRHRSTKPSEETT